MTTASIWNSAVWKNLLQRTTELTRNRSHVSGLIAGEIEQDVRFDLFDSAFELLLIGSVEGDVAGECPVGPICAPGCDGFHAAAHQLLAGGDSDEPSAAQHERPGHRSIKRRAR